MAKRSYALITKPSSYALILRKVPRNMKGKNNFRYPKEGVVTAPDWDPAPKCGGGLHGYIWGKGCAEGSMPTRIQYDDHGKWLVIKVSSKNVVEIPPDRWSSRTKSIKCKFKTGNVVFCGTRRGAAEFIAKDPKCPKDETAERIYYRFMGC
jgi:hypothetical protein